MLAIVWVTTTLLCGGITMRQSLGLPSAQVNVVFVVLAAHACAAVPLAARYCSCQPVISTSVSLGLYNSTNSSVASCAPPVWISLIITAAVCGVSAWAAGVEPTQSTPPIMV